MNEPCERAGLPIDMIETGPTWRDVLKSIGQIVVICILGVFLVTGASIVMTMILATDLVGG